MKEQPLLVLSIEKSLIDKAFCVKEQDIFKLHSIHHESIFTLFLLLHFLLKAHTASQGGLSPHHS